MKEIDESYLRRLVYVKALMQIARQNYEIGTPHHLAQSLLTFDNAVEMMLRLVLDEVQEANAIKKR